MITMDDCHLHGLLLYRSNYYKVRNAMGAEFAESVAGTLMAIIEQEIEEAVKPIKIVEVFDVLEVPSQRYWAVRRKRPPAD